MFDIWWLKLIGWLGSHFYIVLVLWSILWYVAFSADNKLFSTLIGITFIPGIILSWFIAVIYTPMNQFRSKNHLESYFSGTHNTWSVVGPQYASMKRSGVLNRGSYGKYGTSLLGIDISGLILPVAFNGVSGCTTWIKLERRFPHTIIDSTKDNRSLGNIRTKDGAKLHEISLEGDFPANFKVYQEKDQQLLTLQILTPDRMAYLINQLGEFNIEIHDDYLRLYSAQAQKSSLQFRAFLDAIESLQGGLKVDRLNKIH